MLKTCLLLLERAIRRLCLWAAAVAGAFVALIVIIGIADVFGTNLYFGPVPSALEWSEASMVVVVFAGMAYAQHRRAHVYIDLFSDRFTGMARRLSSAFGSLAAALVLGLIAWRAGILAWESFAIDERSSGLIRFPMYPVKAAMFLCCGIATLEALRQFIRASAGLPDPIAESNEQSRPTQ